MASESSGAGSQVCLLLAKEDKTVRTRLKKQGAEKTTGQKKEETAEVLTRDVPSVYTKQCSL